MITIGDLAFTDWVLRPYVGTRRVVVAVHNQGIFLDFLRDDLDYIRLEFFGLSELARQWSETHLIQPEPNNGERFVYPLGTDHQQLMEMIDQFLQRIKDLEVFQ